MNRSRKALWRPRSEWAVRGALAAAGTVAAYFSIAAAVAPLAVKVDPARAHVLAPGDGRVTAKLAEMLLTQKPDPAPTSAPAIMARRALRQDPTAVIAVTTLGLQAQMRGDSAQAGRLFSYARSLSRRELRPQLWAIEEAVSRGDIDGALTEYDLALRTSRDAQGLLYPVLANAIAQPRVRASVLQKLAHKPVWERSFINYVAVNPVDPKATVTFLREGRSLGLDIRPEEQTAVVNALAGRGSFDEAWNYYASFRKGADRRHSRDAEFLRAAPDPALFDWTTGSDAGLIATMQASGDGGLLDFSASGGTGGVAVKQAQMLLPGTYVLEGTSAGIAMTPAALPYWTLTCADGRELGKVPVTNSAVGGGYFTGRFTVPGGCLVQTLALTIRPSEQMTGVTGQIERVSLNPAA